MKEQIENLAYKIRARKGNMISLQCGSHVEVWVKKSKGALFYIIIEGEEYEFVSSHYENTDF